MYKISLFVCLRVELLLKTDGGYSQDTGANLFTLATPGNSLRYNIHQSAPPVSTLTHSRGPRKRSQSPVDMLVHSVCLFVVMKPKNPHFKVHEEFFLLLL